MDQAERYKHAKIRHQSCYVPLRSVHRRYDQKIDFRQFFEFQDSVALSSSWRALRAPI